LRFSYKATKIICLRLTKFDEALLITIIFFKELYFFEQKQIQRIKKTKSTIKQNISHLFVNKYFSSVFKYVLIYFVNLKISSREFSCSDCFKWLSWYFIFPFIHKHNISTHSLDILFPFFKEDKHFAFF